MPIFYYILAVIILLLLAVIIIALVRAFSFGSQKNASAVKVTPVQVSFNKDALAAHLANTIQCATVSNLDRDKIDLDTFDQLHKTLQKNFPLIEANLEKTVLAGHNLIYRWQGANQDLDPILFMAHQDVVPADPASLDQWTQPPFSGAIVDGKIWGRGTLDVKGQMVAAMEAVEGLLAVGYQPERSVYLAFGQDEEIGGTQGQKLITEHFKAKNIHFAAVMDEGGAVLESQIPGVKVPVALVGNCEKGYLTLEIKASGSGGHSSMPPAVTTIGRLARGIAHLEQNPVPGNPHRVLPMFETMGKHTPFMMRLAFANMWLFNGYLKKRFESAPRMAAMIRTTTAVTIIKGGVKDNVLPSEASAFVNFRLSPGDTIESVIEFVKYLVKPFDLEVNIGGEHPWEASGVSDPNSPAFDHMAACIKDTFGDIAIAPYTVMGATDARYYNDLSENVFRFSPIKMEEKQLSSVHNINEYITVDQFHQAVTFMSAMLQRWAQARWVE
jgi:carboxypeptidase PM20D1